jgi:hypothetical protein
VPGAAGAGPPKGRPRPPGSERLHRDGWRRFGRTRPQLDPGHAREEQRHPDRARGLRMGESEDQRAHAHEHERGPGHSLPQRDRHGDDGGEPDEARAEVEHVAGDILLADVVDESACGRLVGGRQRVRRPDDGSHGDPRDRVERRVEDDVGQDERPRDRRRPAVDARHEEPEGPRDACDEEELADVEPDEEAGVVSERGIHRMQQPEHDVEQRGAEEDSAADQFPVNSHRPSRSVLSKNATTRCSYSSGAASIAPTCPPGATQSSFGPVAAS